MKKISCNTHLLLSILICFALFLAEIGTFYLVGEGLVLENVAHLDEAFVIDNAISIAYNWTNYHLNYWMGYQNYSLCFSFFTGLWIKLYALIRGCSPELWRSHFEELLFWGRQITVILFLVSLFALVSILRKAFDDKRALLGILLYVSILGPIHIANIARVEGAVTATTIIFLWSLFKYGPAPSKKGWLVIVFLAALPVGLEIYGLVVVGACLAFFVLNERLISFRTSTNRLAYFGDSIVYGSVLFILFCGIILLMNGRMAMDFMDYVAMLKTTMRFAQKRYWEMFVTFGTGKYQEPFTFFLLYLEFLFPIAVVAIVSVLWKMLRTRNFNWWTPATILCTAYWSYQFSISTPGSSVLIPLIPLIVIQMVEYLNDNRNWIQHITIVLCFIGLFRVTILQISKFYDRSYRDSLNFVLNKENGNKNIKLYYFSLTGPRHIVQEEKEAFMHQNYDSYYRSLPPMNGRKLSLLIKPPNWIIDDINAIWHDASKEKSIVRISEFIKNDFSQYDYVIFDENSMWFNNFWCRKRNPELTHSWTTLYEKLKEGRCKVFETGGVDPRVFIQMLGMNTPWTFIILSELWRWNNKDSEKRNRLFGAPVEVYAKSN